MPKTKSVNTKRENREYTISEIESRWKSVFSMNGSPINAAGFYTNSGSMFINDPYLLNQRIKQLKTSPVFEQRENIENALLNPQENEKLLRNVTHSMLYMNYPLYRLSSLYEGILTYRSYIQPKYVDKKDMSKPRFQSDWKFIDMWHKKLNPQKQFRRIVAEVIPEGKRAYYIRQHYNSATQKEKVDYVHFQDLPSDWYKIIKHSTNSHAVVAFDFTYFWQAGTSLGQFPPIFAEYYNEMINSFDVLDGRKIYNPHKTPSDVVVEYNHSTMDWYYWKELPSDQCFMFSFTEADDLQISPLASLLLQAQDLGSYSLLQQQLLTVPLYSILLGQIPMQKDAKSGNSTDSLSLSPDAVTTFEGKVNSSMPPGTTFIMVPSENNQLHNFKEIPNANSIYTTGLQQMLATSGTSTLMTTTEKPSVAQVNAGKITEKRYIDRIYDQFAWAVNIILEKMYEDGDLKYEWHFRIFGDAFSEKDEYAALEKSLSLGQLEMLPDYLAYKDKSLLDAVTTADWVDSSGIYDKFKPLVNSFGMSGKSSTSEKPTGRPKADENNIESDATAASIDSGQNTGDTKSYNAECAVCGKALVSDGIFCSEECEEIYFEVQNEEDR